jgi:probable rRNA maturation factor
MKREIAIRNAHPKLAVPRAALARAIALVDGEFPLPAGELSVVFLTDPALAALHEDFMADPTTTDVITFEANPAANSAGEICVSADTAKNYAKEHGRDLARELTLYVVHGCLHLAGFDDLEPAKKRRMRAAEKRAMEILAKNQAVPKFRLRR